MYAGFPAQMISLIRCQEDLSDLALEDPGIADAPIMSGVVRCTQCRAKYYINDGILDLISGQRPLDNVSTQEVVARDSQAETYEKRFSPPYNGTEIPSTLRHLGDLTGKRIIELGCGVGRFTTKLLPSCKQVIALDFSKQSLLVLARKLDTQRNVGLVLADATQVRLAAGEFDLALSTQVLEHIPTAEQRGAFFERVNEALSFNGIFVCTAYYQGLARRFRKYESDGFHPSGVFFHRFTIHEIKREITPHRFEILRLQPIHIYLPLTRELHLPAIWLSRKLERVPLLKHFGHLILLKARKF